MLGSTHVFSIIYPEYQMFIILSDMLVNYIIIVIICYLFISLVYIFYKLHYYYPHVVVYSLYSKS